MLIYDKLWSKRFRYSRFLFGDVDQGLGILLFIFYGLGLTPLRLVVFSPNLANAELRFAPVVISDSFSINVIRKRHNSCIDYLGLMYCLSWS